MFSKVQIFYEIYTVYSCVYTHRTSKSTFSYSGNSAFMIITLYFHALVSPAFHEKHKLTIGSTTSGLSAFKHHCWGDQPFTSFICTFLFSLERWRHCDEATPWRAKRNQSFVVCFCMLPWGEHCHPMEGTGRTLRSVNRYGTVVILVNFHCGFCREEKMIQFKQAQDCLICIV